jgi:hypothetical protein
MQILDILFSPRIILLARHTLKDVLMEVNDTRKTSILLVDDSPDDLDLMRNLLKDFIG